MLYQLLKINIAEAKTASQLVDSIKSQIIFPVISLFFVLATVVFLWGVIEMIIGADSEDKRTQGKRHMIYGILGLFIMVAAGAIISMLCQFAGIGASCSG